MSGEKSRGRIALERLAIATVPLFCGWMMFGEKIMMHARYARAPLSYAVEARHASVEAAVHAHIRKSLTWKCYFTHLPEQDPSDPPIRISVSLERSLVGAPVTEPNRYNSNGRVEAVLTIVERDSYRPVYTKTIQYKLPTVFTFSSQGTGNGQEDVFLDTERRATDEIVAYLAPAALYAMARYPVNAKYYAPVAVKSLDSNLISVYDAAAHALCEFGSAAADVAPKVKKLVKASGEPRAQSTIKRVLKAVGGT
jgi:hypothetical protein